jgi:2-oxoglutarate/2-oxoacid ferredoxin oxidoreductase subunit beta
MAIDINSYNSNLKPTWCPGCGNFVIHMALKKALSELDISPSQAFIAFDIGCNGNGADKINTYALKGLHGRSIPLATGLHLANRKFTVIADLGDGACFHEGLDHLIHAIRSNYDITILIHNNQNFALTTGQATITTDEDKPMYGLPDSKPERSLNPSEIILSADPSFYARGYSGDPQQLTELIKLGIQNKGCSVIEIMQLCPTYNEECTPQWFMQRIHKLEDKTRTLEEARTAGIVTKESINTGIIYRNPKLKTYYELQENRINIETELVDEVKEFDIQELFDQFK